MSTDAITNYGVILAIGDGGGTEVFTVIGEITNLEPPELSNPPVEATNHSSGGWREFISGGLKELTEFKATCNYVSADMAAHITKLEAGTKHNFEMTLGGDVWGFNSLITKFKPLGSDAMSPDTMKCELTFRPSGANAIT